MNKIIMSLLTIILLSSFIYAAENEGELIASNYPDDKDLVWDGTDHLGGDNLYIQTFKSNGKYNSEKIILKVYVPSAINLSIVNVSIRKIIEGVPSKEIISKGIINPIDFQSKDSYKEVEILMSEGIINIGNYAVVLESKDMRCKIIKSGFNCFYTPFGPDPWNDPFIDSYLDGEYMVYTSGGGYSSPGGDIAFKIIGTTGGGGWSILFLLMAILAISGGLYFFYVKTRKKKRRK